jgi:hypothetical protein
MSDWQKSDVPLRQVHELEGGDVRLWVEQESVHLKACDPLHADPAELTVESARELARLLLELADQIDDRST